VGKKAMKILRRETDTNFWISYTDLIAGLLFIFLAILLMSHFSFSYQKERNDKVVDKLDYFLKLRQKIANDLKGHFEKEKVDVGIDPKTGILKIKASLLFDFDKSDLKPAGQELLKQVIPMYTERLFSNAEFEKWIKNIVIEGHASLDEEEEKEKKVYLYDLDLSQRRAFSVLNFIFGEKFVAFDHKEELKKIVSAQGRSHMDRLDPEIGENLWDLEYRKKCRRVEIKYVLHSDRMLEELNKIMKEVQNEG
jgi:chemotaxis protein MotB